LAGGADAAGVGGGAKYTAHEVPVGGRSQFSLLHGK